MSLRVRTTYRVIFRHAAGGFEWARRTALLGRVEKDDLVLRPWRLAYPKRVLGDVMQLLLCREVEERRRSTLCRVVQPLGCGELKVGRALAQLGKQNDCRDDGLKLRDARLQQIVLRAHRLEACILLP
tara:strand:+ start:562 stop:945 length:384 start_codon:yes stop_codon:yes gene_type:complete